MEVQIAHITEKLDALINVMTVHEKRNDEQLTESRRINEEQHNMLKELLLSRIENISCDDCSLSTRVEKLEDKVDVISKNQVYILGGITVAMVIAQAIIQIYFG